MLLFIIIIAITIMIVIITILSLFLPYRWHTFFLNLSNVKSLWTKILTEQIMNAFKGTGDNIWQLFTEVEVASGGYIHQHRVSGEVYTTTSHRHWSEIIEHQKDDF